MKNISSSEMSTVDNARIILCMRPANERRRQNVTPSPIGWAHSQNYTCNVSIPRSSLVHYRSHTVLAPQHWWWQGQMVSISHRHSFGMMLYKDIILQRQYTNGMWSCVCLQGVNAPSEKKYRYNDATTWKRFPHYWTFERVTHWLLVDSFFQRANDAVCWSFFVVSQT